MLQARKRNSLVVAVGHVILIVRTLEFPQAEQYKLPPIRSFQNERKSRNDEHY